MTAQKLIDVTGLTYQQITLIEEIVAAFRAASQFPLEKPIKTDTIEADEELNKLHDEFNWLVVDLGIKEPISRKTIYDID